MRWSRLDVVVTWFAALTLLPGSPAQSQTRPDFSGRWSSGPPPAALSARDAAAAATAGPARADLGSGWGRTITITQNERAVVVEWPVFSTYDMQPPLKFSYALDGSESTNTAMMGRGTQRQRSRVRWVGDSLVITTAHAFTDPATGRDVPTEIQQTLVLESPTSLVVWTARSVAPDAAPTISRMVYTKGGGA